MSDIREHKSLVIEGGVPLNGEVEVQGAKNALVALIPAAMLANTGETIFKNVPHIQDTYDALEIAESLGARTDYDPTTRTAVIDATNLSSGTIPPELSSKYRASVVFLGALIGRLREARILSVGGCNIGSRTIDYHHRGFVRLGAEVEGDGRSELNLKASSLKGNYIYLDMPSHTGTENLLLAACLAEGETIIDNAAADPEVVDVANYLTKMGARIEGIGSRTLHISGVRELHGVEHTIISDRHEVSAYAMAAAITRGKVVIKDVIPEHQRLTFAKLEQMGVALEFQEGNLSVMSPEKLKPINIVTFPFPGFPTDAQPLITALATLADGKSYIRETVFEKRFEHVSHLNKMGADIVISHNNVLIIDGVTELHGTRVVAEDIRAGFAMVIAALAANGVTVIDDAYHIDRGYGDAVEKLVALGGQVRPMYY